MKTCTYFIKPSERPPNIEQIKGKISQGTLVQKYDGMKELIRCLVSDETYPPIIMHIITNLIPIQYKSAQLRKIMLLYWEIIQKTKSPTDKTLKQEIFLACNSLRVDLTSHNEYLRGRTLRLVSRIMHKGFIRPLASAITQNLTHKSSYVRRNTVVCLYNVYTYFGSDIIGDIDDEVEELLKTETDLSTKRNAFILLNKTNPNKALSYIENKIQNQAVEEIGDILQLSVLKIFKQRCKEDPVQKPRLLKMINDFQEKATDSVRLQCAITSTSISNSASTIKSSLGSYVSTLAKSNQINVKKIILDKLEIICKNSNYLEQDLIEDLLKSLDTPSIEIKKKIFSIIVTTLTLKTSSIILKEIEKEIENSNDQDYSTQLIAILRNIAIKFQFAHTEIVHFLIGKVFKIQELAYEGVSDLTLTLKYILRAANEEQKTEILRKVITSFNTIQSAGLIQGVLNIFGEYLTDHQGVLKALDELKLTIGPLPIKANLKKSDDQETQSTAVQDKDRKIFKTVILEDGSYSTELVSAKHINSEIQEQGHFRQHLATDSIVGGVFVRSVGRMIYKIRKESYFNKYACSFLMILCSLLRNYEQNISGIDQAIVDQIVLLMRKLINPIQFINNADPIFEPKQKELEFNLPVDSTLGKSKMIEKNPEDLIHFRILKKNDEIPEFDFDDEEVNELTQEKATKSSYISKLKSLVQLTGPFDPLYIETFIDVNKYDLFFDIFMINNNNANANNIQIEFASNAQTLVLQKAQNVNLRPFESVNLRSHLRFTHEFGNVYGYVNYDNQAGLEQPYLITQEIKIEYMQFIEPANISQLAFKSGWAKAQHSHTKEINLAESASKISFEYIVREVEKQLHLKRVEQNEEYDEHFLNCHLYGESKLGEDIFMNLAIFRAKETNVTITVRSRDKAVEDIMAKEILKLKLEDLIHE